jgi:hypothetical protein
MAMVGHKTESIYRRYAITDETMLREAADKLAAYHRAECVKVASKSGAGGASEEPAEVAAYERTALEAASGFEPENRGFADLRLNHLATPPSMSNHYMRLADRDQEPGLTEHRPLDTMETVQARE